MVLTANTKQQTTNNKQQTTNNKHQTTNTKQQTTNNKQRTMIKCSLIFSAFLILLKRKMTTFVKKLQ
jgi:hypothetical protein